MGRMPLLFKGCHVTVTYDADYDIFVGEVYRITDSLSFHGSSIEELKRMFADSIDNYLDACRHFEKIRERI